MYLRMSVSLPLPLLLCGVLLTAETAVPRRCTEVSEGSLEGEPVAPEPLLVPAGQRRHELTLPFDEACGARGAAGVIVTACDVLPPQVEVGEAAGGEWGAARLLRLGPTWLPLLIQLTLFCDSAPLSATTLSATTSPATTSPATTSPATTFPATTSPATTSTATMSPTTTSPPTTSPPTMSPATTPPATTIKPTSETTPDTNPTTTTQRSRDYPGPIVVPI